MLKRNLIVQILNGLKSDPTLVLLLLTIAMVLFSWYKLLFFEV